MKTLASESVYSVVVDEGKNRIFLTNRGAWTDETQVSGWLRDIGAAIELCRPGFTVLIDWTQSSAILLMDRIGEAQKLLMQGGMRRAARLYERETFLKLQMDRVSEKTGFPVRTFYNLKDAETWLEES
jgi:hypothetical protein